MTTTKSTVTELKHLLNAETISGIIFEKLEDKNDVPNVRCILNGMNLLIFIEDGHVYSVGYDENMQPEIDGELGTVDELMLLPEFEAFNKCIHCGGDGFVEVGPECDLPASMCCGGCTKKVECECEHEFQLLNF